MLQSGVLKGLLLHPAVRATVKDGTHVRAAARDQSLLYACEPVNVERACGRFSSWLSLKKERADLQAAPLPCTSCGSMGSWLAAWPQRQQQQQQQQHHQHVRAYAAQRRRRLEAMLGLAAARAPAGTMWQPA